MTGVRTGVLAGFLSLTLLRLISAGLSFALVVLLARLLGPGALGRYSFVMAAFVLLQYLPTMGLHVALTRNVAAAPADAARQLTAGLRLAMPVTGLALLGTAAYASFGALDDDGLRNGLLLVAVALVPTAFTTLVESTLLGLERSKLVARVGLLEACARTLAGLVALAAGAGVDTLIVLFVVGRVLAAVAYSRGREVRALLRHRDANDTTAYRDLARRVPVFFAIMVLAQLMDRMDFVLLGALAGVRQVGEYAAPYKLYELMLMLPRIASLLLLPRLAICLQARGPAALQPLTLATLRLTLAAGLPLALLLAYFAPEVMRLYGRQYAGGAPVFAALCLAAVGVSANTLLSMVLIVTGSQRLDLQVLVVTTLAYAALLALLVPSFGALGAAWATLAVSALQPAVAALGLWRRLSWRGGATASLPVALAGLPMAAILWLVAPRLGIAPPAAAALAASLYLGLLLVLRVPSRGDLRCVGLAFGHRPGAAA